MGENNEQPNVPEGEKQNLSLDELVARQEVGLKLMYEERNLIRMTLVAAQNRISNLDRHIADCQQRMAEIRLLQAQALR